MRGTCDIYFIRVSGRPAYRAEIFVHFFTLLDVSLPTFPFVPSIRFFRRSGELPVFFTHAPLIENLSPRAVFSLYSSSEMLSLSQLAVRKKRKYPTKLPNSISTTLPTSASHEATVFRISTHNSTFCILHKKDDNRCCSRPPVRP